MAYPLSMGACLPTYEDLAREACYSVDQCRAVFLSQKKAVHPETAKHILDAAERIGFVPRRQAGAWRRVIKPGAGGRVEVERE
jgi:DNA-binding LacI/PurR family transcriptional regulator